MFPGDKTFDASPNLSPKINQPAMKPIGGERGFVLRKSQGEIPLPTAKHGKHLSRVWGKVR